LASTLSVTPATGVYSTGSTFTARVVVNTKGAPINAADGTLSFNPKELQVVSVSRSSSIFNLWTTEPTFSNAAGTITFSGGSPTGYTGGSGTVMSVTFRTLGAGAPRVSMTSGSVLAADGRGTNVLTTMGSGAYTVSAVSENPEPETIVEFVPPANTPAAPKITSDTHGNPDGWSKERTARLSWTLPSDVVAVRTLLDEFPSSIPTKVYDTPIRDITIPDLEDGVTYFHIQFRNDEGWGRIAHYRLGVDATAPNGLTLSMAPESNLANPNQIIVATTTDITGAPIERFRVQLNGGESFEVQNEKNVGEIRLSDLKPGRQTIVVEAIDAAGNSSMSTFTFDIESFDAPRFTDIPAEVNSDVIPVFLGTTRPRATVFATLETPNAEPLQYEVTSDETGAFRVIPNGKLPEGVYTLRATAKDEFGAQSQDSEPVQFVVRPSGFIKIGTFLISVLSVIIPLAGLMVLSFFGLMYTQSRYRLFRFSVAKESREVSEVLRQQFARIKQVLDTHEDDLIVSRKTKKLTGAEEALINDIRAVIESAEGSVSKEVRDVTELTSR
jgi:Bacterial Ig-like domain/Cohesin domain